jgi:hypothetical protein
LLLPNTSFCVTHIISRKEEEFISQCVGGSVHLTILLYELGGVQSSRVGGRRRSLCRECWRRWPGRKKRFSGLIKERLNIKPSSPKFFLSSSQKGKNYAVLWKFLN